MTKIKTLTLKEVIETLVLYDLEHTRFPHNYLAEFDYSVPTIRGLCMDDKKLILIDREQCREDMRETIIHELLHSRHYQLGDLTTRQTERIVNEETAFTYKKLYGVKK